DRGARCNLRVLDAAPSEYTRGRSDSKRRPRCAASEAALAGAYFARTALRVRPHAGGLCLSVGHRVAKHVDTGHSSRAQRPRRASPMARAQSRGCRSVAASADVGSALTRATIRTPRALESLCRASPPRPARGCMGRGADARSERLTAATHGTVWQLP